MSAPLFVLGGLGAVGAYLNSGTKQPRQQTNLRQQLSKRDMPNGRNIYDSKRSQTVRRDMMHHANDMYEQSECPNQTGVVPAFWKNKRVKQTDEGECRKRYGDQKSNVMEEFNQQRPEKDPYNIINPNEYTSTATDSVKNPYFNNAYYVKKPFSTDLTLPERCGNIDSNFKHQNMVPFFRGSGATNQIVDDDRHLETFTGQNVDRIEKRELNGLLFEPSKQNPFTGDDLSAGTEDRYIPSIYREDELPFDQTYVGKRTINGNGAYRLHEKNVDELRTRSNPKVTFDWVTIPGKNYVTRSGKVAKFVKNRPERFRTQCINDLIITTGHNLKPQVPENFRPVDTHRADQDIRYKGPIGLGGDHQPNVAAFDYDDKPQRTVKESTMYSTQDQNARPTDHQDKMPAYDYDDAPKQTMKSMNMYATGDTNRTSADQQKCLPAHDYDDKPATTMKELNMYRTGDTNRTSVDKQKNLPAFDYDDKPSQTMKSLNMYSTGDTNATCVSEQKKLPGHDYDDVPATTLKDFASNHQFTPNAGNSEFNKRKSYQAEESLYIKGLKGVTNVYRKPTQNGDKKPLGVEGIHIKTPKERLRWNKRIEMNKVYDPFTRVVPFQRNKREDSVVRTRFMPSIMDVKNDFAISINQGDPSCKTYADKCIR
jgi:hypothetical protein